MQGHPFGCLNLHPHFTCHQVGAQQKAAGDPVGLGKGHPIFDHKKAVRTEGNLALYGDHIGVALLIERGDVAVQGLVSQIARWIAKLGAFAQEAQPLPIIDQDDRVGTAAAIAIVVDILAAHGEERNLAEGIGKAKAGHALWRWRTVCREWHAVAVEEYTVWIDMGARGDFWGGLIPHLHQVEILIGADQRPTDRRLEPTAPRVTRSGRLFRPPDQRPDQIIIGPANADIISPDTLLGQDVVKELLARLARRIGDGRTDAKLIAIIIPRQQQAPRHPLARYHA